MGNSNFYQSLYQHADWLLAKGILNQDSYYKYIFQLHRLEDTPSFMKQYDVLNQDGDIIFSSCDVKETKDFLCQDNTAAAIITSVNGNIISDIAVKDLVMEEMEQKQLESVYENEEEGFVYG